MTRTEFPTSVRKAALERSGGKCECHLMPPDIQGFPDDCTDEAKELDHIDCDMFGGEPTLENAAYLGTACHKIKTKADQAARKTRNKHAPRKDRPKSGWWVGPKQNIPKRKLEGGGKLQGRKFNSSHVPNTKFIHDLDPEMGDPNGND